MLDSDQLKPHECKETIQAQDTLQADQIKATKPIISKESSKTQSSKCISRRFYSLLTLGMLDSV
jgi:hypothetical protein